MLVIQPQDHIGRKSWKLIARTLSPAPSLFGAQRPSTYSQGNMGEFWETRGGVEKMAFWRTKAAISLHRIRYRKSYYGRPIGTHQRSFEWYHPRPPTASSSPVLGFATPTKTPIGIISGTGEATDYTFGRFIHRFHPNKSSLKILERCTWLYFLTLAN